jgi:GH18 family chitinase
LKKENKYIPTLLIAAIIFAVYFFSVITVEADTYKAESIVSKANDLAVKDQTKRIIKPKILKVVQSASAKKLKSQSESFKVAAYFPSWREGHINKLDFSTITHVNYAFAIPTPEGKILKLENPGLIKKIIKRAHEKNAGVLISIGGWNYRDVKLCKIFEKASSTEQKAKKFAGYIAAVTDKYGFDGVDIDWEYPTANDKGYERLIKYLSVEMDKRGKLLTTALPPMISSKAVSDKSLSLVDWVNVMAYDNDIDKTHSSYAHAVESVKYWRDIRKLPHNKVVLGIPFYSRVYGCGFTYGYSYESIVKANRENYLNDTAGYNGFTVNYNGYLTVADKTAYALENAGGIMIWEIAHDTVDKETSLLSAIKKTVGY